MSGDVDLRMLTVGPVQENCFLVRRDAETPRAVVVDPGDEAQRICNTIDELGLQVEAILLTHCHFDHIGAVAPVARHTGAPVYCPELETAILADIMAYVPWEGFGPFESYEADETVAGGERLSFAGIELEVLFTPGHSPGHVTYLAREDKLALSGDVLFEGSIGRTDLPGADHEQLMRTLSELVETCPDDTTILPGHMGATTIGRERASNPFLLELARR